MKSLLVLVLASIVISSVSATAQTRRRTPQKKPSTTFAEKQQAEIRAGREQIAAQIKTLTQFLYLLGGIAKNIETADRVSRNPGESSAGMSPEQLSQSKTKVKESIANVRAGLDKLESSFRLSAVLQTYYPNLSGVARLAQTAENQAAAGNLDQAGRSLIAAANKLADALVAIH